VQRLEAHAAQLHVRARRGAAEHDLLSEDVENAALHGRLEIARGGCKIAWDDDENVIECASSLHADRLRCRRVTENKDKMRGDSIPRDPRDIRRSIHEALNVERRDAARARNTKVTRSLFARPFR
jgi:hypothetical protein